MRKQKDYHKKLKGIDKIKCNKTMTFLNKTKIKQKIKIMQNNKIKSLY